MANGAVNLKEHFIYSLKTTKREGIDKLIKHLEDNGFFTGPCSGAYHLCKEGGNLEHSINVMNKAIRLYEAFGINDEIKPSVEYSSVILASLLHDVGKMGQFGKPNYVPNLLASGKQSDKKPYETNKSLLPVPHEIRSIQIISQFIELTEEESFAILMHNGMYSDLKYAYSGKETPLSLIINFSDLWCSRVTEKED